MNQAVKLDDYNAHLAFCMRFDTWRLKTACSLYTGGLPEYTGDAHPDPDTLEALYEAAVSCAGESLPLVETHVPVREYRVVPGAFVYWASQMGVGRHEAFAQVWSSSDDVHKWDVAEDLKTLKKLFLDATGSRLPQNIAAKLRDFDVRRKCKWRCRALAAYFWSLDPKLTKVDIVRKHEMKSIGCEGERIKERQIGEWIADLNPSPEPGRPRQSSSQ